MRTQLFPPAPRTLLGTRVPREGGTDAPLGAALCPGALRSPVGGGAALPELSFLTPPGSHPNLDQTVAVPLC